MDAPTPRHPARPDPHAVEKRPQIVAGAVAARLPSVIPLPKADAGSSFDQAMRRELARIEQALG